MSSCKKIENAPKHRMQKIVIPKGTINGNETTVIEIPSDLQRTPLIIAKRKAYVKPNDIAVPIPKHMFPHIHSHPKAERKFTKPVTPMKPVKKIMPPSTFAPILKNNIIEPDSAYNLKVTEAKEKKEMEKELEAFQKARRVLIQRTKKLTSRVGSADGTRLHDYDSIRR